MRDDFMLGDRFRREGDEIYPSTDARVFRDVHHRTGAKTVTPDGEIHAGLAASRPGNAGDFQATGGALSRNLKLLFDSYLAVDESPNGPSSGLRSRGKAGNRQLARNANGRNVREFAIIG